MGRSEFRKHIRDEYKKYKSYDDNTIIGVAKAAYSLANLLPCMVVWYFFMIPPERADEGAGGIAMICACCCGCIALLPVAIVWIVFLPFGILAALCGLGYGIVRNCL